MSEPVLICGGGIGGLSAAIALSHNGIPTKVLEQAKTFSEAGAGIEIGPNAVRHLRNWGLMELVSSFSSEPEGMHVFDGLDRELLTTVPLGETVRERFGAPYLIIHRKQLQYCLLEAAGNIDGIEIETGFKVSRFEIQPDGVTARTKSGKTARGCALIGADGLWSTIRGSFSKTEPATAGVTAWRALLPASRVPDAVKTAGIAAYLGPGAHIVQYSLDADATVNLVAMIEETINFDGWASPGDGAELLPFFYGWNDQIYSLLELPDDWHKWTVMCMDPLPQWGEGPVTLVGDAAHPIEPFMAQGGSAAIEDAASLSAAVAAYPDDIAAAFRFFESSRKARIIRIQKASHRRGRIYHMSGLMRWARNQILRRRDPEAFLTRYDWLYRPGG